MAHKLDTGNLLSARKPHDCSRFPRDEHGRAVPRACPDCGNGTLQYEGDGAWRCDGLADPNDDDKELEACTFSHIDGEPRAQIEARA